MAGLPGVLQARGYVERYRGWAIKVSSALLDQVFFSGSGFLINVLLARWSSPDEYGAYVIAFSWFLLAQNIYDAALVEPMAVFGPGKYVSRLRTYLKYLMYAHFVFSIAIFIGLALGALLDNYLAPSTLFAALLGAAVSAPFLLMRWLTRQPFYVISSPHMVVPSGVLYTVLSAGGLWALHQYTGNAQVDPYLCSTAQASICGIVPSTGVNIFWAQIILAIAALLPSLYNLWLLSRTVPPEAESVPSLRARQVIADHVQYGKWSVSSRLLVWGAGQMYYLILPLLSGLSGTASLRALNNLVLPAYLSMGAITAILIPTFVRVAVAEGKAGLDHKVHSVMLIAGVVGGAYFFGIVLFGYPIMDLIYDGKYNSVATLPNLIFLGLAPIMAAAGVAYAAALRAMEKIKQAVQTNIVAAVFTLTIGLLCTVWFGVLGATAASFFAQALGLLVVLRAYYMTPSRPTQQNEQAK